jgi:chemotaxis protein MotB
MSLRRNRQRDVDIWPGFVDALGNLLIILIFVLLVFVLAQFFLSQTLSGRDEALARLNRQINELSDLLNLERSANEDLRTNVSELSRQLTLANGRVEALTEENRQASQAVAALSDDIAALEALKAELEAKITRQDKLLSESDGKLAEQEKISEQARAQAALLRQQLATLEQEMKRLADALDAAEARNIDQEAQISDLGRRLNRALATKVQELQRYRSEFFGRLREILGDRGDIRIEGDRFVFQSEVLFDSASAELNPEGRTQIAKLADSLIQLAREIPADIDWILRVDGHTDRRPIRTAEFKSNWELSAARAISVVNFLIDRGVPPHRLAAAGFGEYQPLVSGFSEAAMQRNRRIELKLDQR